MIPVLRRAGEEDSAALHLANDSGMDPSDTDDAVAIQPAMAAAHTAGGG